MHSFDIPRTRRVLKDALNFGSDEMALLLILLVGSANRRLQLSQGSTLHPAHNIDKTAIWNNETPGSVPLLLNILWLNRLPAI
jgi:hypothetical protein